MPTLEEIALHGWKEAQDATRYAPYLWSQWWRRRHDSFGQWADYAEMCSYR